MAAVPPIDVDRLRDFAGAVYLKAGVPDADARIIADTLVQADLWGHQSHGVLRVGWYLARLESGVMRAVTTPELVVDAGAVAVLDGHDGIGQVIAVQAAREAVARAKAHGIGAVGVRNSNHFGTAMYYTRLVAAEGCIGFLSTNASPAMAPWGGRKKAVGNNPWSIAAPAGKHPPMVLDIANTAVARGKIYLAKNKGLAIPPGWALNAEGLPTTDPLEAIAGIILPMAEHKGYAISMMMDVLSGVLTGSAFGARINGPYVNDKPSGAGHFMVAVDIGKFLPLTDFHARMEQLIAEVKAVPLAPGFDEVFYPGEIETRNEARNRSEGITLPADTLADLKAIADRMGLQPPF